MKRIIWAGIAAIVYSIALPLAALAQEGSSLGNPGGPSIGGIGGTIGGTGGTIGGTGGAGGTAFTGAEIAGLLFLAFGLLAVGVTIVVFSRRRMTSRIEA